MNTDCPICCSPFNKSTAKCITCPRPDCAKTACKSCVTTYLLGSSLDPHCMHCHVAWEQDFLSDNLTIVFLKKDYGKHREKILFEKEVARIPDTQNEVVKYQEINSLTKETELLSAKIIAHTAHINTMRQELQQKLDKIYNMKYDKEKTKQEKRSFIMPCPAPDCKGYLSSAYKCAACSKYACPHCLVVLGVDKDPQHECDPDVVATVEQIKKETKPCPNCGERIGKVDGCNQMWCTKCHSAFDWRTGKIDNGQVHNPHFFQWHSQNSPDGQVPINGININNNPCGQAIPWTLYKNYAQINGLDFFFTTIQIAFQLSGHYRGVNIRDNNDIIENCQNHTDARVQYIVDELSAEEFKSLLRKDDLKRKRLVAINYIYQLFSEATNDIVNNFLAKMNKGLPRSEYGHLYIPKLPTTDMDDNRTSPYSPEIIRKGQYFIMAAQELKALETYTNIQLLKYSAIYNTTVNMVDLGNWRGRSTNSKKVSKTASKTIIEALEESDIENKVYFESQLASHREKNGVAE